MAYNLSIKSTDLDALKTAFILGLDGKDDQKATATENNEPLGPPDDIEQNDLGLLSRVSTRPVPKATMLDPRSDDETEREFKQRLNHYFRQMMFVSGETAEPSAETTWMIEEIVREQVLDMVS